MMNSFSVERNYDDTNTYYQIDIHLTENTIKNIENVTEVICKHCNLPLEYSRLMVKGRLLLSYEQNKVITVDCGENFDTCNIMFNELKNYCLLFMRDNFFKRKAATYKLKKGDD